jgi:hypothetical protein
MSFLNEYYATINNLPEDPNMAKIVVSLNEILIRKDGIYAPRFFTGIAEVLVKFDEDYYPEILKFDCDDGGEYYEHDYVTDFVYQDISPSDEDVKVFEKALEDKILNVLGFTIANPTKRI